MTSPYTDILVNFNIDVIRNIRRRFLSVSGEKVQGGSAWRSLDESKIVGNRAEIWGAEYFYWLNEGRNKTRNGNQGGPRLRDILISWVKRTFNIYNDREAKGLAFVIARNIHEKGWATNADKRRARMVTASIEEGLKELEKGIDRETEEFLDRSIFVNL